MGEVRRKSHAGRPCAVCMTLAPTPVIKWPMAHDCLNISLHLWGSGLKHTLWLHGHSSEEKGDHLKSLHCAAQSLEQMVTDASSSSEKSTCTSWCQTIILAVGVSGSSPFPALNFNLILWCEMFLCDKSMLSEGSRKTQTWKVEWKYQRI